MSSAPSAPPETPSEPAPAAPSPKKETPPKAKPKREPAARETPEPPPAPPPTAPPRKKIKEETKAPEPPPIPKSSLAKKPKREAPVATKPVEETPVEEPDTFAPAAESSDRVVWQFPEVPPAASKRRPLRNCSALASNGNLIAAIGAKVVALKEADGKAQAVWSYAAGGRIPGSPALGDDDAVYIHSADGLLHCLGADGEQAWAPANVGKPLGWASPVIDEKRNIWICGYSGGLMKLNADGSHINRRFFRSREKFDSTGALYDGVFYVGSDDGFVYAIKLEDRRGHNLWDQKENRGLTDWFVNSAPAIGPGPTIVACSRDDCVYAFSAEGEQSWKTRVNGQMLASAVIDGEGHVFVTVSRTHRGEKGSGALVCISGNSHQVEWEYPTDAPCESTPVVGDDKIVYFGDNSGIIHAVDSEGNRVWTASLGSPVRSAGTIPWPRRVVFGLDNETLVALECSSQGVVTAGWPKYMGTLSQSGTTRS